jgi:hypothetical protein
VWLVVHGVLMIAELELTCSNVIVGKCNDSMLICALAVLDVPQLLQFTSLSEAPINISLWDVPNIARV